MLDEKDPIETTEEFEHVVDGIDEDLDDDDSLDDDETEEIVSDITSDKKAFPICAIALAFYVLALLTIVPPIYTLVKYFGESGTSGQPIVWFEMFSFVIQSLFSVAALIGIGYIINLLKNKNK